MSRPDDTAVNAAPGTDRYARDVTRSSPRYAQPATFWRLPWVAEPTGRDVVVVGAPYDGGTSYRPGARLAPRAIRHESCLIHGVGIDRGPGVFERIDVVDGGDLDITPFSMELAMQTVHEDLAALLRDNDTVLLFGGDHSLSLPAMRAAADKHGPLAVLHLDAHSDTFPPVYGGLHHHGTPFRWGIDEGIIEPSAMIQLGIRGHNPRPDSLDWPRGRGVTVVTAAQLQADGIAAATEQIAAVCAGRPLYVSIDVDVCDPAFAPGTGTPAPGGLSSRELLALLDAVGSLRPVGFDVVEVCPPWDPTGITSLLAAELGAELLFQYATSRHRTTEPAAERATDHHTVPSTVPSPPATPAGRHPVNAG